MTAVEALVVSWRRDQLAAYQTAAKQAARPGAPPMHALVAMQESVTLARCANELDALLHKETPHAVDSHR